MLTDLFLKQVQCELKYRNGGQCNALYGHRLSLTLTPVTLAWMRLHLFSTFQRNTQTNLEMDSTMGHCRTLPPDAKSNPCCYCFI